MSTNLKVGGSWESIASAWAKISGTWEQAASIWVKVAGTWEQVYIDFTASASDTTPSGSDSGASETGFVVSNVTTVTPSGGTPPYTYAWAQGPGGTADSGPYNAVASTSAATAFNGTVSALDGDSNENWTCTVTDDDSNETTVAVSVTLTWVDTS